MECTNSWCCYYLVCNLHNRATSDKQGHVTNRTASGHCGRNLHRRVKSSASTFMIWKLKCIVSLGQPLASKTKAVSTAELNDRRPSILPVPNRANTFQQPKAPQRDLARVPLTQVKFAMASPRIPGDCCSHFACSIRYTGRYSTMHLNHDRFLPIMAISFYGDDGSNTSDAAGTAPHSS